MYALFHVPHRASQLNKMPPLDAGFFEGSGNPDLRELAAAEVSNRGESAEAALQALGCPNDQLIAYVLLQLTADNTRVDYGEFALRGVLDAKEYKIPANRIWTGAEKGVALLLTLPAAETFSFSDGGLTSEYKPQTETEHHFSAAGAPTDAKLARDEATARGIGDFCLRVVVTLAKGDRNAPIKMTAMVLLHPHNKAACLDMADSSREAGWPGIFLMETECSLLPSAKTRWGCPIIPLILTGTPFPNAPITPRGDELRRGVAAILGRSYKADAYKTCVALSTKTNRLLEHPEEFSDRPSLLTWPKAEEPALTGELVF